MSATTVDAEDGEIIEIFAEEAGEVLANVERHLATLRTSPTDRAALTEVRRGFHTLKGSGRMVKAFDIGELAWKTENMLNRALEGAIPLGQPLLDLVAKSAAAAPKLVEAFRNGNDHGMADDLESLMSEADVLVAGQAPAVAPPRSAPAPTAAPTLTSAADETGVMTRMNELYRRLERSAQRGDEALHRSEMALQQVRRIAARLDTLAAEGQDRPTRAEINPLIERVNALTREVRDLRQTVNTLPPQETPQHPREIAQIVDQRIRERMAPVERSRADLERQLEEARRAAAAARGLGLWAIGLAATVLAAAVALVATKLL